MANQRRRRRDVGRSSVSDDRLTMSSGTQDYTINDDVIRARAYELYRQRGGQHGDDWDDWFRAEWELRQDSVRQMTRPSS